MEKSAKEFAGKILKAICGWNKRRLFGGTEEEEGAVLCSLCLPQRGFWDTVGLQHPEVMWNWAHMQLQRGLVRLNHERCLTEVGGDQPAPGAGGGKDCFLGTMLILLESQNAVWKADVSCVKTEVLWSGGLCPCPAGGNAVVKAI